jgi:hypothetical protein
MSISELSQNIVNDILRLIQQNSGRVGRYRSFSLEYKDPLYFDLIANIKITSDLYPNRDLYFKDIPSEILRFEKFGFAVDGNSFSGNSEDSAEIDINIAIDPTQVGSQKLKAKLLDVIRHEVEHILQKGPNASPDHKVKIPRATTRSAAQTNYKYFILSDEIPAQVRGLAEEALESGIPVKQAAIEYLTPFLELGFITQEQLEKVISVWKNWSTQHNIKFD